MSRSMKVFRALFLCNLKEFFRDFGSIFFSFAFPLFFVVGIGLQEKFSKPLAVKFGLVEAPGSEGGERLARALGSRLLTSSRVDLPGGLSALKEGDLKFLVVLSSGSIADGTAQIRLISSPFFEGFARTALDAAQAAIARDARRFQAPFRYDVEPPPAKTASEFTFLFPGMLAMGLLQLALFATAAPILRARDRGTLRHLSLTPIPPLTLIGSQLLLRLLVAGVQVLLLLAVGLYLTRTPFGASVGLFLTALLGAAMLIAVGYALAGIAPNIEAGMTLIMLLNFTMLFAGNVFWDVRHVPYVRHFAYALPITYVADMFRQVLSGVSGLLPFWLDGLAVVAWTVAAIAVALKTFRFDMETR